MKIVLVGPAYPLRGGIAHFASLLYRHLSRNHEVRVVTFSRQYPGFFFPGTSQEEEQGGGVEIPSVRLIDSLNPLTWYSAARAVIREQPDLVIFQYWLPALAPCLGTIAALVRRRSHGQICFLCHNVLPHERRPGDRLLTTYAFRPAHSFIALSNIVARQLLDVRPGATVTVVPHPVYESFGPPLAKTAARKKLGISARRVLLFFGIVREYKGLKTLLRALPAVLRQFDVRILVVGEFYDHQEPYKQLLSDLGLTDHVTVVPRYVTREEVATYFSASDAVVLPYWSATQSGIVQIANQFDKPVIATNVGALPEIVRNGVTGLLVPPRDDERLAEAIVAFYQQKMERTMSNNVRKEKRKFSWRALVAEIEHLVPHAQQRPSRRRRAKR